MEHSLSGVAATPPQYAGIDLGPQQSGESLHWRRRVGTPTGDGNAIFAGNNFADVGSITESDGTRPDFSVAVA